MNCIGTYDGTIFYNPANKFCIVSVKTADQSVPAEARSNRRYKDHLIRFTAVGYEIPRTDAVELELDGEWTKGKYGVQLQVEQWREIVPRTKNGVEGYLASGLIKGIGPKTAADIVERFGVDTLDILEHQPERLLEIRGITESKLEDIKASYAENRMLQGIMTLLAPFKITPKTALKIYQYFGPTSVEILEKSPFELCQISGFGFRRVDAIVQKSGGNLHDSMRIKGAVFCALDEGKSKRGHLYISSEELEKSALKLLNEKIPVPELRLHQQEVRDMMQEMILNGAIVSVKDNIYLPRVFAQEDETARRIAQRLVTQMPVEHIAPVLEQVKVEMGLRLSAQQEAAVYAAFRHGLSVITGSPGTGKTTVLRTILEVYRRLHPDGKIALMAPTGRASRRMSESTGFEDARTLHSGLGLTSEEDEGSRNRKSEPLSADLIIVDEFSMVDMWLAEKFFERMKINARIVLVGDPDQLPSVGAGNVFREIIETKIVPVTVLDQIFRQSKDSLIAYNAKFINEGNTKLFYGPDFVFVSGDSQEDTAEKITERYCLEIQESGIENVQILSPFRSEGAASSEQLNETIRELVNPFRSAEEEIKFGPRIFRVNDRIMQTKNTEKVSNGDLGFIRYIKDTDQGKKIGMDFGAGRTLEYGVDDLSNVDLAYATTIHKAMGSEYEIVIMPLLKAHTIMMYRNLLYTGITRAKKRVVLIGQKQVLFMAIHRNEIGKRNRIPCRTGGLNMNTNYIIETKNLTKQYGSQKSVADLNIHVKRGRIYGLLGRNGAGKTTTMKMLLGLTNPTSGEVKIWGKSLQGNEKKLLPRIGSLIESPGFYPNLTGTENLRIFATLRGVPNNHAVKDALDLVGLPYKDKKLFSQYSLGMKQRLAIALAVMHDPELLILDEPINGLDPIGIAEVRSFIRELCDARGKTILISSHILSEISLLADDIGIIDHGALLEEESLAELEQKSSKHIRFTLSDTAQAARILERNFHESHFSI